MSGRWAATFALALFLGVGACGGQGDDDQVGTSGAAEQSASPATTPDTGLTVTVSSPGCVTRGYGVSIPEGWTPVPNFVSGRGLSVDAFFAPEVVGGVQPNITVTREELPEGTGLRSYFDKKTEILRQVEGVEPEISSREVASWVGLTFRLERVERDPPLETTGVVFTTGRCGWSITLTVPHGARTRDRDLFDEFLASFNVLP